MHFEPGAYGITSASSFLMTFAIECSGQTTFDLEGFAGSGTLENAGIKVLSGKTTVTLGFHNGSGGASQTKVTSGGVVLPVSGIATLEYLGSTGKTALTFTWNAAAKAYVAAGLPAPVGWSEDRRGGCRESVRRRDLYEPLPRTRQHRPLDWRTDFVRVWQNQRANFFNRTWSSQPWYAVLGNTRQMGFSSTFAIDLRWEKP